jgi:tRNA pseudouridine55 synthase
MDKSYVAHVRLGLKTDTGDVTGRELEAHGGPFPGEAEIEAALLAMTGEILQAPPAFSAIKVGGRTAHKEARAGRPLDLAPRRVFARSLRLLSWSEPVAEIEAEVSSGYYVRSLAQDLGEALGLLGGALSALKRLKMGAFRLSMARPLPPTREAVADALISPREALGHLPEVVLEPRELKRLGAGAAVPFPEEAFPPRDPLSPWEGQKAPAYKIIGPGESLFALAEIAGPGEGPPIAPRRPYLRPLRVFGPPSGHDANLAGSVKCP